MPADAAIVRASGLRVRFGDITALDGLELTARDHAITAVLGPNGAGKTTFVRTVAILQPFDEGTLSVCGADVRQDPATVRGLIGLAGQHAAVVEQLTGRENLDLVARLYGQGRRTAAASAERVIAGLSLEGFAERRVSTYSGGERRRLDLGASTVGRPRLLLLDEPTTGLDPRSRGELWRLIRELPAAGTAVLLTTQYLEEAAALGDHIVIIDRGRLAAAGTPAELRRSTATTSLTLVADQPPATSVVDDLATALDARAERRGDTVHLVGRFTLDAAYEAVQAAGLSSTVSELSFHPPTLDEVFLGLTGPTPQEVA